ncbi:hypothetical protein E3N88_04186 [Mikania micrantha]|uniref:Uncharacterized protein n=1 Tax=Mikania micrantha TaxID=192012 RepID=A0A5N6PVW6_9ASTR|nr:hypothetical protein E3N88_04186 [Mikania micrantha]
MMSSKLSRKVMKMAWQGWWMVDGRFKPATCLAATLLGTLSLSSLLFTFVVGDDDIESEPMTRVTISLVAMMSSKLSRKVMKMAWQGWWMVGSFSLNLDIDVEDEVHKDFLRANLIVRYHELSFKTWFYFSTVAARWDADLYIKAGKWFVDKRARPGDMRRVRLHYAEDLLYFWVEDVESFAWTPKTLKSVEKRGRYKDFCDDF